MYKAGSSLRLAALLCLALSGPVAAAGGAASEGSTCGGDHASYYVPCKLVDRGNEFLNPKHYEASTEHLSILCYKISGGLSIECNHSVLPRLPFHPPYASGDQLFHR